LTGTVAQNVLEHGVGGLNIDATRIQGADALEGCSRHGGGIVGNGSSFELPDSKSSMPAGRWPANIILDEYTAELIDEQSGVSKSPSGVQVRKAGSEFGQNTGWNAHKNKDTLRQGHADSGGASRFFYVAKASKRDRNEGLDELPEVRHSDRNATDGVDGDNPRNRTNQAKQNFHPTVKPTALMQYLIRLVTPANGVVLDPFAGSGSTGKAAILENKHFIGIELTPEYLPIIEGRLQHAYETLDSKQDE
jgi:site-specific DNA-methyltransferase (adenine-specific)